MTRRSKKKNKTFYKNNKILLGPDVLDTSQIKNDMLQNIEKHFNKKFTFQSIGSSPGQYDEKLLFSEYAWKDITLEEMKIKLLNVKGQLDSLDIVEWHRHTSSRHKAKKILSYVKFNLKVELPTQAWCKFQEILSTFPQIVPIIPFTTINKEDLINESINNNQYLVYNNSQNLVSNGQNCNLDGLVSLNPQNFDPLSRQNQNDQFFVSMFNQNSVSISSQNLVPINTQDIDKYYRNNENGESLQHGPLKTFHLCEAPGAFITSLNHYLTSRGYKGDWSWKATTLNPMYEGNSCDSMIDYDLFIVPTLDWWTFGDDDTGDLLSANNIRAIVNGGDVKRASMDLVTCDGSICCANDPAEQEVIVSSIVYVELVTSLMLLKLGGSMVIKMFTLFESSSISIIFLLYNHFEQVNIFKPASSKPGNSEVYIVAVNFLGIKETTLDLLFSKIDSKDFQKEKVIFPFNCVDPFFLVQHRNCCKLYDYQIEAIQSNLKDFYRVELDKSINYNPVDTLKRDDSINCRTFTVINEEIESTIERLNYKNLELNDLSKNKISNGVNQSIDGNGDSIDISLKCNELLNAQKSNYVKQLEDGDVDTNNMPFNYEDSLNCDKINNDKQTNDSFKLNHQLNDTYNHIDQSNDIFDHTALSNDSFNRINQSINSFNHINQSDNSFNHIYQSNTSLNSINQSKDSFNYIYRSNDNIDRDKINSSALKFENPDIFQLTYKKRKNSEDLDSDFNLIDQLNEGGNTRSVSKLSSFYPNDSNNFNLPDDVDHASNLNCSILKSDHLYNSPNCIKRKSIKQSIINNNNNSNNNNLDFNSIQYEQSCFLAKFIEKCRLKRIPYKEFVVQKCCNFIDYSYNEIAVNNFSYNIDDNINYNNIDSNYGYNNINNNNNKYRYKRNKSNKRLSGSLNERLNSVNSSWLDRIKNLKQFYEIHDDKDDGDISDFYHSIQQNTTVLENPNLMFDWSGEWLSWQPIFGLPYQRIRSSKFCDYFLFEDFSLLFSFDSSSFCREKLKGIIEGRLDCDTAISHLVAQVSQSESLAEISVIVIGSSTSIDSYSSRGRSLNEDDDLILLYLKDNFSSYLPRLKLLTYKESWDFPGESILFLCGFKHLTLSDMSNSINNFQMIRELLDVLMIQQTGSNLLINLGLFLTRIGASIIRLLMASFQKVSMHSYQSCPYITVICYSYIGLPTRLIPHVMALRDELNCKKEGLNFKDHLENSSRSNDELEKLGQTEKIDLMEIKLISEERRQLMTLFSIQYLFDEYFLEELKAFNDSHIISRIHYLLPILIN